MTKRKVGNKKVYKIRNRKTGFWSRGGSHQLEDCAKLYGGGWDRKGKTWPGIGALRNHLNFYGDKIPEEWEVVEYEVKEEIVGLLSARDLYSKKDV